MLNRWSGQTVCIMASGQSLTQADAAYARERAGRVIVINRTWERCPTADVLYAADCSWWLYTDEPPKPNQFTGERWTTSKAWDGPAAQAALKKLNAVETKPATGTFSLVPPLVTGRNSSYQALGLAAWWGARRIVFLGLDLHGHTWHEPHKNKRSHSASLAAFREAFTRGAPLIKSAGVEVLNASPGTALDCFPKVSIREAFP